MSVRIIPARKKASKESCMPKIKVAAYARVSTDLEEQESSYETQVAYYTNRITSNPEWVFAGIYADEGISGTGTKYRLEFNRMISDCEKGKINLILTKSISRFARNTLDCLTYIRRLKDIQIAVYFEKEGINTLDARGEMLITIMAGIAQQESQSISQNVSMGIHYNFSMGKVMLQHNSFLGYTKQKGSSLSIVPEEAVIVRRIFRDYLDGLNIYEICSALEKDGIHSPGGKRKWHHATIASMLKNEKYMGDLLLQKNYTQDFLTKKLIPNTGELPKYYVRDAHEPIVPRSVFFMVQGILLEKEAHAEEHKSNIALNKKLICSRCGSTYKRCSGGNPDKACWKCRKRLQKGTPCHGRNIMEKTVNAAVLNAFQMLKKDSSFIRRLNEAKKTLQVTVDRKQMQLNDILHKIDALEQDLSDLAETNQTINEDLYADLDALKEEQNLILKKKSDDDQHYIQINTLLNAVSEQPIQSDDGTACTDPAAFFASTDHKLCTDKCRNEDIIRFIEYIVVQDASLDICFKAGLHITIEV